MMVAANDCLMAAGARESYKKNESFEQKAKAGKKPYNMDEL